MVEIIYLIIGLVLGVLIQRIYLARVSGLFEYEGKSLMWSSNRVYLALHRLYCEICPRRFHCEAYWRNRDR